MLAPTAITSLAPKILTDTKELERIKPYLDALKKTIDDNGISNIALTGGYGSGKSTILKTFQHTYKTYRYLNISLASFKDVKEDNPIPNKQGTAEKGAVLERQLEVSILQQIFYHVKPSDIPDSRFKRIINVTDRKIWTFAIGLIFWVASALILFKFSHINQLDPFKWNLAKKLDVFALFFILIFFAGIGMFAKTVVRLFSNSKINKFTIKGELELGDNLDKSVFNEHLEEILYFFERTDYNVVVIEDLDRFESTDIFTKLREINILLNNSKLIGREINFIYAIRDEMFKDKSERVKFFEYIIPVIPFINPTNAGDQLAKLVAEASLQGILSKDFTEDVVTFIDDIDMRLLTNIFHEYQIYRLNLSSDLNQDHLFAIIIYKNLFPEDFGQLHKRGGNLYTFINSKASYVTSMIQETARKIKALEQEIQRIEQESIEDIEDLRRIYVSGIFSQFTEATGVYIDDQLKSFEQLLDQDIFDNLRELTKIKYAFFTPLYHYDNGQYQISTKKSDLSFSDIEDLINSDFRYDERAQFILDKQNDKESQLRIEIQKLRDKRSQIDSWSLVNIFREIDIEEHLGKFSDNQLMRNLLLNGYINENYNDYISLFHEVNITKEDFAFERRVKSGEYSPYNYKLTALQNLIRKMPPKYFAMEAILNYDLFDYLAEHYEGYEDEYSAIINTLANGKQRSVEFIDGYISQRESYRPLFIQSISKKWKGFWEDVLKRNYTEEKVQEYLKFISYHADIDDIVNFKSVGNIASYIERLPGYLSLVNDARETGKIKDIITKLGIKFDALDIPSEAEQALFDHVYNKNYYKINPTNVALFLKQKNDSITDGQLNTANYTTLSRSGCAPLKEYIEANINEYTKNILLKLTGNTLEEEESLTVLLNNENLLAAHKNDLISKKETLISDLTQIQDDEVKKLLIEKTKIVISWSNLLSYYDGLEHKSLDDTIIDYLNNEGIYQALSATMIKDAPGRSVEELKEFIIELMKTNELQYNTYITLLKSVHYTWNSLHFENLSTDKVHYLTENRKLNLTKDNYDRLKDNFDSVHLHITLIENNQEIFAKDVTSYELNDNDIIRLLESSNMSEANKVLIIQNTDDETIINNAKISKLVCKTLAFTGHIQLSYEVLQSLFKNATSIENKIRVFNKQVNKLENAQIKELISDLNLEYSKLFKRQCKPKFIVTDYHQKLFEMLDNKSLISSFGIDPKNSDKFRVLANY
ncbi:hypothetical protein ACLI09_01670 [Flavobacterium sp. RHBU_24]|uniref:YobI family P-loop NTPase n=1 Tax=Flavobacterium sp. RHBU_24 TaxID=3391185 RepID=UPI0039850034